MTTYIISFQSQNKEFRTVRGGIGVRVEAETGVAAMQQVEQDEKKRFPHLEVVFDSCVSESAYNLAKRAKEHLFSKQTKNQNGNKK